MEGEVGLETLVHWCPFPCPFPLWRATLVGTRSSSLGKPSESAKEYDSGVLGVNGASTLSQESLDESEEEPLDDEEEVLSRRDGLEATG